MPVIGTTFILSQQIELTKNLTAHAQKGSSGMLNAISRVVSRSDLHIVRRGLSKIVILACVLSGPVLTTSCSKAKVEPFSPGSDYTLGRKIVFGESGDSEKYRVSGWSNTEKEITWTEGSVAVLKFTGINATSSLRLKMTLTAMVNPPQLPSQPVEVFANGQKVADWEVSGKSEFTALIPLASDRWDKTLTVELKIPKAVSPKALGVSEDPRVLGLSCFDLVISETK